VLVVLPGSQVVSSSSEQRSREVAALFSETSDENYHSTSPVSLRAAFVSSPRYHRNTCPANLATVGHECVVGSHHCGHVVSKLSASPPAAAADEPPMFSAPALTEETLLDVRHRCLLFY